MGGNYPKEDRNLEVIEERKIGIFKYLKQNGKRKLWRKTVNKT